MVLGAWSQLAAVAVVVSAVMLALWLRQLATRNASHVDVAWSASIGISGLWLAFTSAGPIWHRALLGALPLLWGLGLALHLHHRLSGKPEDSRYASLRRQWGARAPLYFFIFFQLQTLAVLVFVVPVQVALRHPRPVLWLDLLAVLVWLLAVAGERLADQQLAAFKARGDTQGKTCREGLWRYSRHPNYFFEWVHWWAYVVAGIGHPLWLLTLLGPGVMFYLLTRVTGIPTTEAQAVRSRGDDYRRYQQETSAFFPWFPRPQAAERSRS